MNTRRVTGSSMAKGSRRKGLWKDGALRSSSRRSQSLGSVNRPAFEDLVSCGSGFDRVWADREDLVAPDCERVFLGFASEERFFRSIPDRFFRGLHPVFT